MSLLFDRLDEQSLVLLSRPFQHFNYRKNGVVLSIKDTGLGKLRVVVLQCCGERGIYFRKVRIGEFMKPLSQVFVSKLIGGAVTVSFCLSTIQAAALMQDSQGEPKLIAGTASAPQAATSPGNSSGSASLNAEILKELEQMRARIAELEARLKAQQAGAPVAVNATITTVQPGAPDVSGSLDKTVPPGQN